MKKYFTLTFVALLILLQSTNASAAYPYYSSEKNRLTTGISGVTLEYFITSNAAATRLNTDIPNAVYKWVNTSSTILWTPLWMAKTSVQSNSQADFYTYWVMPDETKKTIELGITLHYVNSTLKNPANDMWYWSVIKVNTFDNFSYHKNVEATCAHEIGHFLGLAHQNDTPSSIMAQDTYRTYSVIRASKTDLQNLVNLY